MSDDGYAIAAALSDSFANESAQMVAELTRLRAVNADLLTHLQDMADRFERCCIATGSGREMAAQAVAEARWMVSTRSVAASPSAMAAQAVAEARAAIARAKEQT